MPKKAENNRRAETKPVIPSKAWELRCLYPHPFRANELSNRVIQQRRFLAINQSQDKHHLDQTLGKFKLFS
jgi:hypothetical protein